MMTRDDLANEIYDVIYENASYEYAKAACDSLMKKIDEYVEGKVIEARLKVMKNFGAI